MKQVLSFEQISFRYDQKEVLNDINFTVDEGNYLAIVGPNGSGKSTLLKCIVGIVKPHAGTIRIFGEPIELFQNRYEIGFVSQKANSFNSGFPATVYEVVESGLTAKLGLFKRMNSQKEVEKALSSVDMLAYAKQNIGELSGGQQQRVFIARALVSQPKMLVFDEPTVGIDVKQLTVLYELLAELNQKMGMTILLVTHDFVAIEKYVTHVACLCKKLHFMGDVDSYRQLSERERLHVFGL